MSHHTIDFNAVSYQYPDGTAALSGISLHIGHGEAVAVVGANGSGKTTLLAHLCGLLFPTEGNVNIGGYPVRPQTLAHIRETVGLVMQNPEDQLFMPTVYDDVAFGPVNMGLPPADVERRVTEALTTVGALALRSRPPYRLSGGQKRAVAIATVLAMEPSILVMDEPTAELDPFARRQLINLLNTFPHTQIIATHDLDMVLDLCERTIILSEGRVLADGATRELFMNKDLLTRAHLEQPFAMQACPVCSKKNNP